MATIYDIAREAQVSISTVSRAFGRPQMVSAAVRERVMDAATRLGYRPNRIARALAEGRSRAIGLLLPGEDENPYFQAVAAAANARARASGYELVVSNHGRAYSPDDYVRAAEALGERQVEGYLLYGTPEQCVALASDPGFARVPAVMLGSGPVADFPGVGPDEEMAGHLATTHLLSLGHRNIVSITSESETAVWRREHGYARAMGELGLEPVLWRCEHSPLGGRVAAAEVLEAYPQTTGLIAVNDVVAVGAMKGLAKAGRDVPGEIAVVGYDNITWGEYTSPSLTTVDMVPADVGRTAVAMLLGLLTEDGWDLALGRHLLPTRLVPRGSTGPCRAR